MICIGSDHAAYDMKEHIKTYLTDKGYEVKDLGPDMSISVHYPLYGEAVAKAVTSGECEYGIVLCGTGIGISMAASKVTGIRCALCTNTYMARMAREHNDANVLALGARVVGYGIAEEMVDIFLKTEFQQGRHAVRVDMINDIDARYSK